MTTNTLTKNEWFGYEETYQGRLKFFNEIAEWQLEDWFTQPLKDYGEVMSDDEKVDFIQNKLMEAYEKEVDYRYDETDQECLYDIDHVVVFNIKNTPENMKTLEEDSTGVYAFHHAGEEDWDFLDKGIIWIEILNEWDWLILSRENYSERMIENFCAYYGINEDDVLNKLVHVNG